MNLNLLQLKPSKLPKHTLYCFIPRKKKYIITKKVAIKYDMNESTNLIYTNLKNNITLCSNYIFYFTFFYSGLNFFHYRDKIKKEKEK